MAGRYYWYNMILSVLITMTLNIHIILKSAVTIGTKLNKDKDLTNKTQFTKWISQNTFPRKYTPSKH